MQIPISGWYLLIKFLVKLNHSFPLCLDHERKSSYFFSATSDIKIVLELCWLPIKYFLIFSISFTENCQAKIEKLMQNNTVSINFYITIQLSKNILKPL